jgi:GT2 family glycosyltransferase
MIRWLSPGHTERADLAVLMVSWNVKDLVLKNIEALLASEGSASAELIVIDNASKDATVEAIRAQFPQVRVIANTYNAGFSLANTQGMIAMQARHCLLLNPDMKVEVDSLQKTIEYLDTHPEVGVMGARLETADGKMVEHVRSFPTFGSQLAILLKLPHLFPRIVDSYLAKDFDYSREQVVDSIRGSYFAIHARALEACAGLDTRYFIWFEEVDYCKKVTERGMKVVYVPTIKATDFIGRSFAQRDSFWKQKNFTRSMVQYFEKWHPWWETLILRAVRLVVLGAVWIVEGVLNATKPAQAK